MDNISQDKLSINGSKFEYNIAQNLQNSKEPIFEEKNEQNVSLQYGPNDIPEWYKAIPLGFQQAMVCMAGLFVTPYIVSETVCAGDKSSELRAKLISTAFVISGIATILQCFLGIRLANLQGPSFGFFGSLYAFASLPEMKCNSNANEHVSDEDYLNKLRMIQGSLICASFIPMILGTTGLIGVIARRVGPITICPVLMLLALDNVGSVVDKAQTHWISLVQFVLMGSFATFFSEFQFPLPYFKHGKIHFARYRLLGQFPYLFSIIISYTVAAILSGTNAEPKEGPARIDKQAAIDVLTKSPWFQVPYPGQFGMPKFHLGLFIVMVVIFLANAVEAIGGYHVLAEISGEKPPPSFMINRAVFFEGFGSLLSGLTGLGVGLTAYSENVAAVSITRVASRFVMLTCGILLIALGLFTKFAAILATIPDPIIGGLLGTSMCLIFGVAITNLQTVDLKLSRNLTIIGIAVMCGMYIPEYFSRYPVKTDSTEVNQTLSILLGIRMIIGGLIAFILDNLVPGATLKQRGFHIPLRSDGEQSQITFRKEAYDYPTPVNRILLKIPLISKLPFMPSTERLKSTLNYDNVVQPVNDMYRI
uniref:Uncharacterized protein n=1 Tax=Acrobeloides nanus TaxID=290746 RepID=A0A914E9A6_9BILA